MDYYLISTPIFIGGDNNEKWKINFCLTTTQNITKIYYAGLGETIKCENESASESVIERYEEYKITRAWNEFTILISIDSTN